jgi:hypothetical protein
MYVELMMGTYTRELYTRKRKKLCKSCSVSKPDYVKPLNQMSYLQYTQFPTWHRSKGKYLDVSL